MRNKNGFILDREECYLAYISSEQNIHLNLSQLREHIVSKLLSKCDGKFFTFELFDEFVSKMGTIVEAEGYVLFPDDVKMIKPL